VPSDSRRSWAIRFRVQPECRAALSRPEQSGGVESTSSAQPQVRQKAAQGTPGGGWVVGSSETNDQHLVIHASPRPVRNAAKVVNGPAWYPGARVRPLRSLTINGWRMRAAYVPVKTNAGSAFMRHVVLIWTVRGHTYGIGFHKRPRPGRHP
jgi:hypothetical protein